MTANTYRRLTQPTDEPVTLTEAKAHLRVDGTAEDDLITALISAARSAAETYCNRAFAQASFVVYVDEFPAYGAAISILPDVAAVTAFTYFDLSGDAQVVSSSDYIVDATRREVRPHDGEVWPYGTRLAITMTAGPDCGASPPELPDKAVLAAIKIKIADLYENREAGQESATFHNLLVPHRVGMGM
jgi:uncharacterized phiE125 gp8 family phage protein